MATLTSTSPKGTHFGNYSISAFSLFFLLIFLFLSNNLIAQADIIPNYAKSGIADSTELKLEGLEENQDIEPDASSWYEYFWIHGDGNFTTNTRDTFIHARYLYTQPGTTSDFSYFAKAYSTSVYRTRGRVPTKMEGGIITNDSFENDPDSIATTQAVESGYLHLQFNHSELVPGDTTVWVLSIKNPLADTSINTFKGEVYLFFNSSIKVHKSSVGVEGGSNDDPDNPVSPKVVTKGTKARALEEEAIPRYADFVFEEDFIYKRNFLDQSKDVEANINDFPSVSQRYKSGLVWHFDGLQGGEERHLFLQFKDAENIFESALDPSTKVVGFLGVITAAPQIDNQDIIIPDSLDEEELKIISDLQLDGFISNLPDSLAFSTSVIGGPNNTIIPLSPKIIDIFKIEPLAKRAHDPNQLTIQACSCPPESDGAQKLIFTTDFENDGDANALGAVIRIPLDSLIDASSIAGDPLGFFGPELKSENISMTFSENQDTIIWTLLEMVVESTKAKGSGHPSTYGQITFTALTKAETKLEDISEMQACIQFIDAIGPTGIVCTQEVLPTYLTLDQSKTAGTQAELQCEECILPGCQFPLWLIFLIILVIGFAIWIAFDNA